MSNKDLEKNIMDKIKTGQVKLKSKYVFLAEKLGLGTAFTLSTVLSILLFNLTLFYMKETDNLQYLSFGKRGILAFLESFPYMLVVSFIILILLAGYLISKSEAGYKKPLDICSNLNYFSNNFWRNINII
jgi:preprotein translocase subunit SecG